MEALAEALATLPKSGVRWWEAELHRLKGELLLQHAVAQPEEAEACFQQALTVARRQQAKSLELRAAMSLSRLWQRQGKRSDAHQLLECMVGSPKDWSADLQEAGHCLIASKNVDRGRQTAYTQVAEHQCASV